MSPEQATLLLDLVSDQNSILLWLVALSVINLFGLLVISFFVGMGVKTP